MSSTPIEVVIPDADPAGDGSSVTGTFTMTGNVSVTFETRTQQYYDNAGLTQELTSVVLDWLGLSDTDKGDGIRKELALDLGGGIRAISIDFVSWEGSDRQWGDTGTGGTVSDGTGEAPLVQAAVFDRYLQTARLDSTNPAQLSVGEYSASGRYALIDVIPENPTMRFDATESASTIDGSVSWIEVQSIVEALDLAGQVEH